MAGKIDYPRNDKYRKDYVEALEPWKKGRHDECVQAAKYNLTDPTLPRYFQIKNRILMVSAEHDWSTAENCRIEAERIYAEAVSLTKTREVMELCVLEGLRVELDQLKESHGEDPRLHEKDHVLVDLTNLKIREESTSNEKAEGKLDGVAAGAENGELKEPTDQSSIIG